MCCIGTTNFKRTSQNPSGQEPYPPTSWPTSSRAFANASGSFSGCLPPACAMSGFPPPPAPDDRSDLADPVAGTSTTLHQVAANAGDQHDLIFTDTGCQKYGAGFRLFADRIDQLTQEIGIATGDFGNDDDGFPDGFGIVQECRGRYIASCSKLREVCLQLFLLVNQFLHSTLHVERRHFEGSGHAAKDLATFGVFDVGIWSSSTELRDWLCRLTATELFFEPAVYLQLPVHCGFQLRDGDV